jgi:hypothetical protein
MAELKLIHDADAPGYILSDAFDPPPSFLSLTPEEIAADEARQRSIAERRKAFRLVAPTDSDRRPE